MSHCTTAIHHCHCTTAFHHCHWHTALLPSTSVSATARLPSTTVTATLHCCHPPLSLPNCTAAIHHCHCHTALLPSTTVTATLHRCHPPLPLPQCTADIYHCHCHSVQLTFTTATLHCCHPPLSLPHCTAAIHYCHCTTAMCHCHCHTAQKKSGLYVSMFSVCVVTTAASVLPHHQYGLLAVIVREGGHIKTAARDGSFCLFRITLALAPSQEFSIPTSQICSHDKQHLWHQHRNQSKRTEA